MTGRQVVLFPIPIDNSADELSADQASLRVNSPCIHCGGSGWRQVEGGVTRCACRRRMLEPVTVSSPRSTVRVRILIDHKSAAAGER